MRSPMAWRAGTVHGQIAVGTELSIYKETWEPGEAVRPPPSGASLATRFAHGAATRIKVLEVTGSDAIIQTSNRGRGGCEGIKVPLARHRRRTRYLLGREGAT